MFPVFKRPSFDGRVMVWRCPSVRTSVRPSVRSVVHNPCGQDIARTICPRMLKLCVYTLYGQREKAYLFSRSKVKFQGQWAFTKNSGTWILVGRI